MNRPTGRKRKARLIVVSAPSGCGKTTLCKKLLEDDLGLVQSVSMTTRPPRPGEKSGKDYVFVPKERFLRMVSRGAFLEHEDNFGFLYGTPRQAVEKNLRAGRNVLLSIDVKGAMKVKRAYPRDSVLIFVLPPSLAELRKRLVARKSDTPESIAIRLAIAKKEMASKGRYDYRLVNDSVAGAYRRIRDIVLRETGKN